MRICSTIGTEPTNVVSTSNAATGIASDTAASFLQAEGEGVEPSRLLSSSRFERGAIADWLDLPFVQQVSLIVRGNLSTRKHDTE